MSKAKIRLIDKDVDCKLSKNFKHSEISCHCNYDDCTFTIVVQKTLDCLQTTRAVIYANKPFTPTNVYRCQHHNADLSKSSKKSRHKKGLAADIPCPPNMPFDEFIARLENVWQRVLPYKSKSFCHCDNEIP